MSFVIKIILCKELVDLIFLHCRHSDFPDVDLILLQRHFSGSMTLIICFLHLWWMHWRNKRLIALSIYFSTFLNYRICFDQSFIHYFQKPIRIQILVAAQGRQTFGQRSFLLWIRLDFYFLGGPVLCYVHYIKLIIWVKLKFSQSKFEFIDSYCVLFVFEFRLVYDSQNILPIDGCNLNFGQVIRSPYFSTVIRRHFINLFLTCQAVDSDCGRILEDAQGKKLWGLFWL